jgi:hypothetical protein
MDSFFFRVEHELLRSEAFKTLGGSAIKVYLVIGLYADFGTGWAYPSIRTIARQGGLSRQTVLAAIEELTSRGLLATSKSRGKSTAYKVMSQAPERPKARVRTSGADAPQGPHATGPDSFGPPAHTGPDSFKATPQTVPISLGAVASFLGPGGPTVGPKLEQRTREDTHTIPIPGTPFQLTLDGRLLVVADLQGLLAEQGIPQRLAQRIAAQKDPSDVAKVLLNAFYLQSQGKLQNGPGYLRAGIEDGYDLLPQVAARLESRRRELEESIRKATTKQEQVRVEVERESEDEAMGLVLERLSPDELDRLVERAVGMLPGPIVRRNPTLSNPFVRGKVYELAGGEPDGV